MWLPTLDPVRFTTAIVLATLLAFPDDQPIRLTALIGNRVWLEGRDDEPAADRGSTDEPRSALLMRR